MKNSNTILTLFCICFSILISCDKDESADVVDSATLELARLDEIAKAQNASENRKIPVTELSKNITVTGATTKSGVAPAPTGSVSFRLIGDNNRAQLKSGFSIKLESSENNIAGAYIQLLDSDKNKVDGYFDVPITAFINGRTKELEASEIDLNFDDGLQPGTFCYEICLYDTESNVSRAEEVCVEVEAWGGNANLVGTWEFNNAESDYYFFSEKLLCQNGDSINFDYDYKIENWVITFSENGTYRDLYKDTEKDIKYTESQQACEAIFKEELLIDNWKVSGNWSYDEESQELTIVTFNLENLINPSESRVYENGDLYFESAKVSVTGNKLTLTLMYEDQTELYSLDKKQ